MDIFYGDVAVYQTDRRNPIALFLQPNDARDFMKKMQKEYTATTFFMKGISRDTCEIKFNTDNRHEG